MCCKGMLKRVMPFLLTLAVGLFIASFFVDLSPTRFRFERGRRFRELQELRIENADLKNQNAELKEQIRQLSANPVNLKWDVPPPPLPPAPAKIPSRVMR